MPGFSGKYYYTLDEKGRLMMPAPFRESIFSNYSARLYVTNAAFDNCLNIYPFEEWLRLEEKVKVLPRLDSAVKYFLRRVVASAVEVELDRQGRLLIPSAHRQDSGLGGEVVLVGQVQMIELWDRQAWAEETDPSRVNREAFEASLIKYGL